jgi:hypothetical protein
LTGCFGLHDADWICHALCWFRPPEECKEHVSILLVR